MEQKLEIGGKEYTFFANRKSALLISKITEANDDISKIGELLDEMFYMLLKKKHDLSMEEVEELLDIAEQEYELKDLIEFCVKLLTTVFTEAEENKKKKIAFLSQK